MRAAPVALALLVAALAGAEPYGVGTTLRPFALEDQHGDRIDVGEAVRILVVSRDMDAGDVVKTALGEADQAFLDRRGALYVADISRMPAMVSRLIAVPRMRKRPYRVLLDREGDVTRDLPSVEKKPTVLFLDRLRIVRVMHPATAADLRSALAAD